MNVQIEWWGTLTTISPFLLPLASAIVVLLIRDLLDPRQWRRYVRKILACAVSGIGVFALILTGYAMLSGHVADDDSFWMVFTGAVVGLGIIPATVIATVFAFNRVEPNVDWYMNSRFRYSFKNGSWPILSVFVPSECLPKGASFIGGQISAVQDSIGEYQLRVAVGTVGGTSKVLNQTTRNPGSGWVRVMREVRKAQLGDLEPNRGWQERFPFLAILGGCLGKLDRVPAPTQKARYRWQDRAYLQIHRLARRVDASGVVR